MRKLPGILLMLAAAGFVFAGSASALSISYTDTTTKDGFNIEYILNVEAGAPPNHYDAIFTINSSSTSADDWYAGAFNFKFFNGNVPTTLFDLTPITEWSIADAGDNVSIGGWSALTNAGRAGFYLTGLASDLTLLNVVKGVKVSETNTAIFTFGFSGEGDLNETMPFQVAYWMDGFAGRSTNIKFGQLSETLSIPEPANMLLLGTGLIGLAAIGRKKIFKK